MASSKTLPFLAMLLVLLPMVAMADLDDIIDGNLTAFYERLCQQVDCGKGTCVGNKSYTLSYKCECQPGWKQTQYADEVDDDNLFLPCVIPNCTLNYGSCQPAPPPVPEKEAPHNVSFFDPCSWMYCGEGTCTRNGTYRHSCTCKPGFYNLLGVSYYPCYSNCTLGSDCSEIIRVASSTAGGSGSSTTPGNPASTILPGKLQGMIILLMAMFMTLK